LLSPVKPTTWLCHQRLPAWTKKISAATLIAYWALEVTSPAFNTKTITHNDMT